jgi:hypothetical protein
MSISETVNLFNASIPFEADKSPLFMDPDEACEFLTTCFDFDKANVLYGAGNIRRLEEFLGNTKPPEECDWTAISPGFNWKVISSERAPLDDIEENPGSQNPLEGVPPLGETIASTHAHLSEEPVQKNPARNYFKIFTTTLSGLLRSLFDLLAQPSPILQRKIIKTT